MDDCKARLKPTTYKGKQDVLEKHIIPYFKNFKVNEIQAMTVRRCKCQYKNDQKVENKNVHFPRSIPQTVLL